MRSKKLVHPSHARTVLTEQEAARLRAGGWLELPEPRAVNRNVARQRRFYENLRAAGFKQCHFFLSPEVIADFVALKRPHETRDQLFVRMVETMKLLR